VSSYPTKSFRRTALAPGILAAIVLLAGLALFESSTFFWIKTVTAILAAIVAVYAYQAKQWWWLPFLAAIVVLWNPIWQINLHQDKVWLVLQYVAAILFVVCGVLIKIPNPDDRNRPAGKTPNKNSRPSTTRR
jgi:hypothetical protein